jgi:glycosyltransferase involved in cell wall biosynthesis
VKVLTVTDAWHPQVNGVVRTIEATNHELVRASHRVALITPQDYVTVPCPGYREIRLSLLPYRRVAHRIAREARDEDELAIHIATEGPLGQAARRYCVRHRLPFTTAYHTRFPQYLRAMFGIPETWVYGFLRRFHGAAKHVLSPTPEVDRELAQIGLGNVARWTRGVDLDVFRPREAEAPQAAGCARPRFLYVGRVSVE